MLQLVLYTLLNLTGLFHIANASPIKKMHPFYVSVTEIEQNPKTRTIEVSVKIFYDDFEKTLNKDKVKINILKPADRKQVDALIADYINKHLKINASGKLLALKYIGYEIQDDAAWCYFESSPQPPVRQFDIQNDLLFEAHPSQSNMIHAIVNGQRKSTKLDNPSRKATLVF
ncbi:hypothetical protein LPB86_19535 [Pedobacter sp. MC2016-14]|uniref:DUF6702 family protein n=1 Tax=Pedobacter sp. MC2016-14 TaxID=2897327 RepID=UPI001E3B652B|nr:DUF6702 family protein [Pedobacter sp. MC2016-14]MCD0490440.1 hypothetical protein [Pedobacter sp. MC2016-14]